MADNQSDYLPFKIFCIDKRYKLISENIIDSSYTFTKDYIFSSPSTAASIISGNSTNGKTAWRNLQGITLKDYET